MLEWALLNFQPAMPFNIMSDTEPDNPNGLDVGLLFLRWIGIIALMYYQVWDQVVNAARYLWNKTEWDVVDQFQSLSIPFPGPLAVSFLFLLTIFCVGIALGILTRMCSTALLLFMGFILVAPIDLSKSLNPQTLVLYMGVFLTLLLGGAGKLSLDFLLAGRKVKAQTPF